MTLVDLHSNNPAGMMAPLSSSSQERVQFSLSSWRYAEGAGDCLQGVVDTEVSHGTTWGAGLEDCFIMVIDNNSKSLSVEEARKLRHDASELLNRLIVDREQSERRFAESGKRDPMKFITGRTALDSAIASTRDLIDQMDRLLVKLNGELDETDAATKPIAGWPSIRFQPRVIARSQNGAMHPQPVSGRP